MLCLDVRHKEDTQSSPVGTFQLLVAVLFLLA
jgi:hypothetical protein